MNIMYRFLVITAGLLCAVAALLVGRTMIGQLSQEAAETLVIEQKWLMGAAVLYGITFLSAWHFRGSFSISASRMLIWAIIAYIALSHGFDIIAPYRSDIPYIFGLGSTDIDPQALAGIRTRIINMAAVVVMGIVAIGVGFESH